MALNKSQNVFKRAIMLRKKTGMSLKAAFKAAKKGGAEGEPPSANVADALKQVASEMPSAPSGPGGSEVDKGLEKKEGGRRRGTKRGKGKGGRLTRRRY